MVRLAETSWLTHFLMAYLWNAMTKFAPIMGRKSAARPIRNVVGVRPTVFVTLEHRQPIVRPI